MERLSLSPMSTANDDMKEDPLHSQLQNALLSNLGEETFTLEDLAWADSCLNEDADASDANCLSVKDALLEIFNNQQEPLVNPSVDQSSTQVTQLSSDQILYSGENPTTEESSDEDEDSIEDDDSGDDDTSDQILYSGENPTTEESSDEDEDSRDDDDSDDGEIIIYRRKRGQGTANEDDIFKVWDLEVSDEQDNFTKQLNKALVEVPPQLPSYITDSVALKVLFNVPIEDLTCDFAGLSLDSLYS